jgi:hypothetical protein
MGLICDFALFLMSFFLYIFIIGAFFFALLGFLRAFTKGVEGHGVSS